MSELCPRDIIPRHGPGVVATGEKPWQKRYFKRIYQVCNEVYPIADYFYYNYSHLCDRLNELLDLEDLKHGTAKVVLVPKDSRGPRLISCEPLELQWLQQGQMRKIVPHLESHWLTRGHVNFTDQSINQQLALRASSDGSLATLDMKEASDRVSLELVKYLFPAHWFEALYATRSSETKLPNGQIVRLNKFAPMGSAVCFPVEALIFWALCVSIVSCTRFIPLAKARETIYVYGDDIICSSEDHAAIRQYLPLFDLMVNDDKCCVHMTFKESCGCDAYKGVDVTPTKVRSTWSPHLDTGTYASWVAYSNAFHSHGYDGAADYIESVIQKIRTTPYYTSKEHDGIGFYREHVDAYKINRTLKLRRRFNKELHRYEVLGWSIKTRNECASKCDWEELLRVVSYKSHSELIREPNTKLVSTDEGLDLETGTIDLVSVDSDPTSQLVKSCIYAVRRRNSLIRRWSRC